MFSAQQLPANGRSVLRYLIQSDGRALTTRQVLENLQESSPFREFVTHHLADCPFSAFRWETPPVRQATVDDPFEFVLLDSPGLDRTPEPEAFADHFRSPAARQAGVTAFWNLGRDAMLIVPCPIAPPTAYGHIASFVRQAPAEQQHDLWQLVGSTVAEQLSDSPLWLSTAGAGVTWLHVRLDQRPKYYGYAPYRDWP